MSRDELNARFLEFLEERLSSTQKPEDRRKSARAFWEVVSRPLPKGDPGWPFFRFFFFLYPARFRNRSQRRPELRETFLGLGFTYQAVDSWKRRLKPAWEKLEPPSPEELPGLLEDYGPEDAARDLENCRRILEVTTSWTDTLGVEIQLSLDQPETLIMVRYPPGHEAYLPGLCLDLQNRFSERRLCWLRPKDNRLCPVLQEASNAFAVLIPEAHRFTDLVEALRTLRGKQIRTLLLWPLQPAGDDVSLEIEAWKSSGSQLVLATLKTPEELREAAQQVFAVEVKEEHRRQAILTLAHLQALHISPSLSVLTRVAGCEQSDILSLAQGGSGFLRLDEDTVSLSDPGWCRLFIERNLSLEERAEVYQSIVSSLDPNREDERSLLGKLLVAWSHTLPAPRRLAHKVFCESRQRFLQAFSHPDEPEVPFPRLDWAKALFWMGEYQAAQDLLLRIPRRGVEFAVEKLNADIFKARFRDSGRIRFFELAEETYRKLIDGFAKGSGDVALALADLYRLNGQLAKARELLESEIVASQKYARAQLARILWEEDRLDEARKIAVEVSGARQHPLLLAELRGTKWSAYVDELLQTHWASPGAIEQCAVRALERGLFEDARKLLERGLAEDPDNLYLNALQAKWLHEQGRFLEAIQQYDCILRELVGTRYESISYEHDVLQCARLDSTLEHFREQGVRDHLRALPSPLTRKEPPPHSRSRAYYHYLVALEAKAIWYQVPGIPGRDRSTTWLVDRLAGFAQPVLFNLAARIACSRKDFCRAFRLGRRALVEASGYTRVRTLNNLVSIALDAASAGGLDDLREAEKWLQESLDLDDENTYSLALSRRLPKEGKIS